MKEIPYNEIAEVRNQIAAFMNEKDIEPIIGGISLLSLGLETVGRNLNDEQLETIIATIINWNKRVLKEIPINQHPVGNC